MKNLKAVAAKNNKESNKQIKVMQSGVTEGKNSNEWLKQQLIKLAK